MEDALIVDQLVAGTAHVIDDFVPSSLSQSGADPRGQIIEHLVPAHLLPFALTTPASASKWVKDSLGVVNLVEGRVTLGAVTSAAAWMRGVALEFSNAAGLLIDVGEQ